MIHEVKNILILLLTVILLESINSVAATDPAIEKGENGLSSPANPNKKSIQDNIFFVYSPFHELRGFKTFANQISRLRQFGRVDAVINFTTDKATFEMPAGGSPWHEYTAYDRSLSKFFPDKIIAPFIPEDFVKKNRQLLFGKQKVLNELGLGAAYRCNEPHFLPEAFFDAYPHLRGPRVDHPRRSLQKEFAPCMHQPETQKMYRNMSHELFKNVPEIHTVYINMNDAGSGFCWADWLYSGPNGPSDCKNLKMSERILYLVRAFQEGAAQTGHDISILMRGMFTDNEIEEIIPRLPDHCYIQGVDKGNFPPIKNIGSMAGSVYPVKGIINPYGIIKTLNGKNSHPQWYSLSFGGAYDRGLENPETIEKVIDITEDYLANPPEKGLIPSLQYLHKLCVAWAGNKSADQLLNAFVALDNAFQYKQATLRGLSTLYWGVSTRQITRPLVFAPKRLSPKEEKYFLPYVFNISVDAARQDYMDIHGGSEVVLPPEAINNYLKKLKYVYTSIENTTEAPEEVFLQNMAISLRIYSSIVRSCSNFYQAQEIRNRNLDKLNGPVHRPDKTPTWTGDQDFLKFNNIMRDELDNTQKLIDLLENGGMDLINHANKPEGEDTFLLGPDLINQLKQKRKIMLDHWRDIEDYLTSPYK